MKLFALVAACAAFLCAQAPQQFPDDAVIATADGKPITAGAIRAAMKTGDPKMLSYFKQSPDNFLAVLVTTRFLVEEAEKAHFLDQSPWKEQLEETRKRILINAEINYVANTYQVPQKDIDAYYAHNQSRFEQAWIKVIVLGFCPSAAKPKGTSDADIAQAARDALAAANCGASRTEAQGLAEATKIVARVRAGEDFVKMVKQYSEDDDSKATDGDFGLVTRDGSFKPEIKDAVFALKDGEVSNPIRSGASFYIIKIKEHKIRPLSEVLEAVIGELRKQHFDEFNRELTKRLKPTIDHPEFFTQQPPPSK
jgi:peptidyl-prolyl cis-trans isomerase C